MCRSQQVGHCAGELQLELGSVPPMQALLNSAAALGRCVIDKYRTNKFAEF